MIKLRYDIPIIYAYSKVEPLKCDCVKIHALKLFIFQRVDEKTRIFIIDRSCRCNHIFVCRVRCITFTRSAGYVRFSRWWLAQLVYDSECVSEIPLSSLLLQYRSAIHCILLLNH